MTDQEFENLKEEIEQKTQELEDLQKKYSAETGCKFYPPFRLNKVAK